MAFPVPACSLPRLLVRQAFFCSCSKWTLVREAPRRSCRSQQSKSTSGAAGESDEPLHRWSDLVMGSSVKGEEETEDSSLEERESKRVKVEAPAAKPEQIVKVSGFGNRALRSVLKGSLARLKPQTFLLTFSYDPSYLAIDCEKLDFVCALTVCRTQHLLQADWVVKILPCCYL